jgi:hypothetical protein
MRVPIPIYKKFKPYPCGCILTRIQPECKAEHIGFPDRKDGYTKEDAVANEEKGGGKHV